MNRQRLEDLRIFALWMILVTQLVIGVRLMDQTMPPVWLVVGCFLVIGAVLEMGAWVRWCVRLSVRARTYTVCDSCAARELVDSQGQR